MRPGTTKRFSSQLTRAAILGSLLVLPLLGASAANAQPVIENIWQDFQKAWDDQKQAGTRPGFLLYHIGVTDEEHDPSYERRFIGGRRYLIVAACDRNCNDIDLFIRAEEDGEALVSNEEDDDVPQLIFTPRKTGSYFIEVTLWCDAKNERCGYGFGVFQLRG